HVRDAVFRAVVDPDLRAGALVERDHAERAFFDVLAFAEVVEHAAEPAVKRIATHDHLGNRAAEILRRPFDLPRPAVNRAHLTFGRSVNHIPVNDGLRVAAFNVAFGHVVGDLPDELPVTEAVTVQP